MILIQLLMVAAIFFFPSKRLYDQKRSGAEIRGKEYAGIITCCVLAAVYISILMIAGIFF